MPSAGCTGTFGGRKHNRGGRKRTGKDGGFEQQSGEGRERWEVEATWATSKRKTGKGFGLARENLSRWRGEGTVGAAVRWREGPQRLGSKEGRQEAGSMGEARGAGGEGASAGGDSCSALGLASPQKPSRMQRSKELRGSANKRAVRNRDGPSPLGWDGGEGDSRLVKEPTVCIFEGFP